MNLTVDFINPLGNIGFASRLDKIEYNVNQIESFKQQIEEKKAIYKNSGSAITVAGRWIIIYQFNVNDDSETIMYFMDFRVNTDFFVNNGIFSAITINGISQIQKQYELFFSDKNDTVELVYAEPFEKVIQENIFLCDQDLIVIDTAKRLGVLPIIEKLKEKETVKVALVDDKESIEGKNVTNIYAVIHFDGHKNERENENGYIYIKLFDCYNNKNKVDDFKRLIKNAGGHFDHHFFIERFSKENLN